MVVFGPAVSGPGTNTGGDAEGCTSRLSVTSPPGTVDFISFVFIFLCGVARRKMRPQQAIRVQ
jgi:hypothetical protein